MMYSQEFQRGSYSVSYGTGLGIYGITTNDTIGVKDTGKDIGAVKILFPFSANYFFTDRWAAGVVFQFNKILVVPDTMGIYARTVNYGINNKIIIYNNTDDNVYFDFSVGSSLFSWRTKNSGFRLTGRGVFYNLGLGINHYFNNNLGFYIYGGIAAYQYNTMYNTSNHILTTLEGTEPLSIKLGGINLSTGLCFKF